MSPTMALLHRPAEWVEEAGRRMTPVHALVKNIGVDLGLAAAASGTSAHPLSPQSIPGHCVSSQGNSQKLVYALVGI